MSIKTIGCSNESPVAILAQEQEMNPLKTPKPVSGLTILTVSFQISTKNMDAVLLCMS